MDYSRVEVVGDVVARREATAVILFKQKVEIATLPSVARNDITLLDVTAHQQVVCDDNLNLTKVVRFARPPQSDHRHGYRRPILEEQYASFVGKYPIPIRYGMTPGELAGMIKEENWMEGMERLIGIQSFRDSIDKMRRPDSILEEWNREIEKFAKLCKKYLLYR